MIYLTHLWEGWDRTWGGTDTLILLPWASRLCAAKILDRIFVGGFWLPVAQNVLFLLALPVEPGLPRPSSEGVFDLQQ